MSDQKQHQYVTSSTPPRSSDQNAEEGCTRPAGYPPLSINYQAFKRILNSSMVKPFDDEKLLSDYYFLYKRQQYARDLNKVRSQGYQTVHRWAKSWFADWTMDGLGNALKQI
jgi:hypothetical protein